MRFKVSWIRTRPVSCPEISPINWERATAAGSVGRGRIEVVSLSEHLIQPPPRTKWSPLLCRWALTKGGEVGRGQRTWMVTHCVQGTRHNASICHQRPRGRAMLHRAQATPTGHISWPCLLFWSCFRIIMASGVSDVIPALTLWFLHHALFRAAVLKRTIDRRTGPSPVWGL